VSMHLPLILASNPTAWLTPVWLIGAGCLGGLIVLAMLFGLAKLILPKVAQVATDTMRESFVFPFLCLVSGFAGFALLSVFLSLGGVGYLPWEDITRSLERLPKSKKFQKKFPIPGVPASGRLDKPQEFALDYRPQEIRSVEVKADHDLEF